MGNVLQSYWQRPLTLQFLWKLHEQPPETLLLGTKPCKALHETLCKAWQVPWHPPNPQLSAHWPASALLSWMERRRLLQVLWRSCQAWLAAWRSTEKLLNPGSHSSHLPSRLQKRQTNGCTAKQTIMHCFALHIPGLGCAKELPGSTEARRTQQNFEPQCYLAKAQIRPMHQADGIMDRGKQMEKGWQVSINLGPLRVFETWLIHGVIESYGTG